MNMEYRNEAEREEYKKRIQRQSTAIDNLLEIAFQHTRLFREDMIAALKERKSECERLYRKLDKNEFEIAIVGLEKAGKSTFANALIGNQILPDAQERCTYTSTSLKYGKANQAVVKFFTQTEFDRNIRDKLKEMGIENTEQYSIVTLQLKEYERLFASLGEKEKRLYETNINEDVINILKNRDNLLEKYLGQEPRIFEGEQLKSDEFKQFIISPNVAISVKEVLITSSELEDMPNAVIYDVPGFDSPTQMHEDQTVDKMKKADAIILIASADKPSLTAPTLKVFHKVSDEDGVELCDKLFIFGNRADAATTLEKNINTLKNEARERNLLKGSYIEERLFVGSARAHLQKIGQQKGDECIKKIEGEEYKRIVPYGDGIKYTYEKLVEYNMTDRFKVLKRKVNQNSQEIQKIFEQLRKEYSDIGNGDFDIKELAHSINKLQAESRKELLYHLKELREKIRDTYNRDFILSARMQEEILKLFESEKYGISEQDLTLAKREVGGIISSIDVEKVEELIREAKFKQIYADFSEIVLKIAIEDHKKYYSEIIEMFEKALQINANASSYESIMENVKKYIQEYKKDDEAPDSYQSLIERFARDLIEILIMKPYGMEARLNRFLDDIRSYTGLIMFYNSREAAFKDKKTFMSIAPKDQPLLYALLFHEYKDSIKAAKSVFNYMEGIVKGICNEATAVQLICSIIKKDPFGAFNIIKNDIPKEEFTMGKDGKDKLIPKLRTISNRQTSGKQKEDQTTIIEEYDFTDEEKFKVQYQQHFVRKELRTYEDMQKEYSVDLEILKDFLVCASIPAISIEKPFVAKEVKSIDRLMESIESERYAEFITNNFNLLLKEEYEKFDRKQSERLVNKAVVKEIEKVLKDMTDVV